MLKKYLKEKYGIDIEKEELEEAVKWTSKATLYADAILNATKKVLEAMSSTPIEKLFIADKASDRKLVKTPVQEYILKTILSPLIEVEETGQLVKDTPKIRKALNEIVVFLSLALYRAEEEKKKDLDFTQEIIAYRKRFKEHINWHKLDFNKRKRDIALLIYKRRGIEEKLVDALKEARKQKVEDLEIENKEKIKNSYNQWKGPEIKQDNILLLFLFYALQSVTAKYPTEKKETFWDKWAYEVEIAGLNPEDVEEKYNEPGTWGFSITAMLGGRAINALKKEAITSKTAKYILDQITTVTTLKRTGETTWTTTRVFRDDNKSLTGNV